MWVNLASEEDWWMNSHRFTVTEIFNGVARIKGGLWWVTGKLLLTCDPQWWCAPSTSRLMLIDIDCCLSQSCILHSEQYEKCDQNFDLEHITSKVVHNDLKQICVVNKEHSQHFKINRAAFGCHLQCMFRVHYY